MKSCHDAMKHEGGTVSPIRISLQPPLIAIRAVMSMAALTTVHTAAIAEEAKPEIIEGPCAAILDAKQVALHPGDLQWTPLPTPRINGAPAVDTGQSRTALLEGVEGSGGMMVRIIDYKSPATGKPHIHPSAERTYVLAGSIGVVVGEGDEPTIYSEGSYATIPAYTRHYAVVTGPVKVLTIQVGDYKALPVPAK